jgi:hypothetical protein
VMSLDGYIAPESVPVEDLFAPQKQDDPDVQRWMAQLPCGHGPGTSWSPRTRGTLDKSIV